MNVAYHTTFTWMNPEFSDLRTQIQVPLFGEFPIELGVSGNDEEVLMRFSTLPTVAAIRRRTKAWSQAPSASKIAARCVHPVCATLPTGQNAGDGRDNPFKSEFVHGFEITEQERADILAFLKSLTDESFLVDPKFSNPFEQ